jgi:hypothetical protein
VKQLSLEAGQESATASRIIVAANPPEARSQTQVRKMPAGTVPTTRLRTLRKWTTNTERAGSRLSLLNESVSLDDLKKLMTLSTRLLLCIFMIKFDSFSIEKSASQSYKQQRDEISAALAALLALLAPRSTRQCDATNPITRDSVVKSKYGK